MRAVYIQQSHVTHFARHPSHDSPLTSHVTRQRYASHDTRHTSHVSRLNSNVFRISSTSTTVKIHYATQHREHSAITSLTSHTAHDSQHKTLAQQLSREQQQQEKAATAATHSGASIRSSSCSSSAPALSDLGGQQIRNATPRALCNHQSHVSHCARQPSPVSPLTSHVPH
jgi:hypothetical protein